MAHHCNACSDWRFRIASVVASVVVLLAVNASNVNAQGFTGQVSGGNVTRHHDSSIPLRVADRADSLREGLEAVDRGTAEVLHAGGAVRLRIPADWTVQELPHGRQLRLVVSPPATSGESADVRETGALLWLSLRYRPDGLPPLGDEERMQVAAQQMQKHLRGRAQIVEQGIRPRGEARWARIDFALPSVSRRGSVAREADQAGTERLQTTGSYWLQHVDWGQLEVCSLQVSRDVNAPDVLATKVELQRIVGSIQLHRPSSTVERPADEVRDALDAIGLWKSSRSTVRFDSNGRITVVSDQSVASEKDPGDAKTQDAGASELATQRQQAMVTTVVGQYTARDDLIFTVWDDGSKLNYRWKLHHGDLLLTDHRGRTAKLWRLAE